MSSREEWTAELRARQDKMRARSAPGSVRPTVGGSGRPKRRYHREPVPEWRQGPGDRLAGTVASANRLGTARSDRGDALTADAPARTVDEWRVHLRRLRVSPSLIEEIASLEGWGREPDATPQETP